MKPTCPRCIVGGYVQGVAADGRPSFTCTRCGYHWTSGATGGKYIRAEQGVVECVVVDKCGEKTREILPTAWVKSGYYRKPVVTPLSWSFGERHAFDSMKYREFVVDGEMFDGRPVLVERPRRFQVAQVESLVPDDAASRERGWRECRAQIDALFKREIVAPTFLDERDSLTQTDEQRAAHIATLTRRVLVCVAERERL